MKRTNESYIQSSFAMMTRSESAGTVRAAGGDLGGGSETLVIMKKKAKLKVYENHPADCRIKDMGNVCQTIGAGGRNRGGESANSVIAYKGNGNITGRFSCTITGDHNDRITDFTVILVEKIKMITMLINDMGGVS